jgi:hypothetical protein
MVNHVLESLCGAGVNKYSKRPNGIMIAVFGMSSSAMGISPNRFWKKLCNHASHLKGLPCLARGIYCELFHVEAMVITAWVL